MHLSSSPVQRPHVEWGRRGLAPCLASAPPRLLWWTGGVAAGLGASSTHLAPVLVAGAGEAGPRAREPAGSALVEPSWFQQDPEPVRVPACSPLLARAAYAQPHSSGFVLPTGVGGDLASQGWGQVRPSSVSSLLLPGWEGDLPIPGILPTRHLSSCP